MEMDPVTGIVKLKRRTPEERADYLSVLTTKYLCEIQALKVENEKLNGKIKALNKELKAIRKGHRRLKQLNERYKSENITLSNDLTKAIYYR